MSASSIPVQDYVGAALVTWNGERALWVERRIDGSISVNDYREALAVPWDMDTWDIVTVWLEGVGVPVEMFEWIPFDDPAVSIVTCDDCGIIRFACQKHDCRERDYAQA